MASAPVSELVIFIAAVSVAAGVSGAMVTTVGGISDSLDERGADISSEIATDIEIISEPGSGAVYDSGNSEVRVLIKNTGGRTVPAEGAAVEVLIDGRYVPSSKYTVTAIEGGTLREGDVARIEVDETLAAGDHSVTVIVESEQETLQFRT